MLFFSFLVDASINLSEMKKKKKLMMMMMMMKQKKMKGTRRKNVQRGEEDESNDPTPWER